MAEQLHKLMASVLALTALFMSPRQEEAAAATTRSPSYRYDAGFWRNLHHMLYAQATVGGGGMRRGRIPLSRGDQAALEHLTDSDQASWASSVAYYQANLRGRDLLFDKGMIEIGKALSATSGDKIPQGKQLPPELVDALRKAAPIYRKHWWNHHKRLDEAWISRVKALSAKHGGKVFSRVADAFASPWPKAAIQVAVVPYANWAGAYTSLDPICITIASADARHREVAALEILVHESAHGLAGDLIDRLDHIKMTVLARPGANAAAVRPDLWHELLFYIVGRIMADAVPGYIPYADQQGLWKLGWPGPDRQLIETNIDPYLKGQRTLDAALTSLVSDLAATPTSMAPQERQ